MKYCILITVIAASLVSIEPSSGADTDLAAFTKEMSNHSGFRKIIQQDFAKWDGNDDGRLDDEDGAIGPKGLFLTRSTFDRVDESRSNSVSLVEFLEYQMREAFYALDLNRNGSLSDKEKKHIKKPAEFFKWLKKSQLSFIVEGDKAYLNGTTNGKVVKQFQELFKKHPEVKTLVFGWMPGSDDDEKLLKALEIIKKHGVTTHAADHARIQSGGVDLFTVGTERTIGEDVEFGVHSWSAGRKKEGRNLDRTNRQHKPYLDYYNSVDVPADFYWFTLEAAVADAMHIMTKEELLKYRIITESAE